MKIVKIIKTSITALLLVLSFLVFYRILILVKEFDTLPFIIFIGLTITSFYYLSNYLIEKFSILLTKLILENKWNKPISKFIDYMDFIISNNDLIDKIKAFLEIKANLSVVWIENDRLIYKSPSRILENDTIIKNLFSIQKEEGITFYKDSQILLNKEDNQTIAVLIKYENFELWIISKYISLINPNLFSEIYEKTKSFVKRRDTMEKVFEISVISHEWELLSQVQKFFLPENIPTIPTIDLALTFEPLVNVSGDYYCLLQLDNGNYLITIGDVAGKGLNASLLMAIITNTIKISKNKSIQEIIYEIDKTIKWLNFEGKYTTIILGIYNPSNGIFEFVNSATPPLILVKNSEINSFPPDLPMIGIIQIPEFKTNKIKLEKGDIIFITTDGLMEATNNQNIQYQDTNRLQNILKNNSTKQSKEIAEIIRKDFSEFLGNSKLTDDITYMVIKKEE